jgi:threonine/homoserine/homoserine lactone efflux protein
MSIPLFAAAIFGAAVLMSLPLGPVQFEVWREAMAGHRGRAMAIVIGAVTGDIVLALAVVFGLNPWSKAGRAEAWIFLIYAAVLIGLGVQTLRQSQPVVRPVATESGILAKSFGPGKGRLRRRWAYLRGVALVVLNPLGAASWAVILAVMTRRGASLPSGFPEIALFILAVGSGVAAYPSVIILFARRLHLRMAPMRQNILPRLLGGGIIGFGLYFLYRAIHVLAWI